MIIMLPQLGYLHSMVAQLQWPCAKTKEHQIYPGPFLSGWVAGHWTTLELQRQVLRQEKRINNNRYIPYILFGFLLNEYIVEGQGGSWILIWCNMKKNKQKGIFALEWPHIVELLDLAVEEGPASTMKHALTVRNSNNWDSTRSSKGITWHWTCTWS